MISVLVSVPANCEYIDQPGTYLPFTETYLANVEDLEACRRECSAVTKYNCRSVIPPTPLSHCNENPIYLFLFWELRGLIPNIHIHVSVCDLNIPRMGPHISCSRIV
jgi:hypothetical protein